MSILNLRQQFSQYLRRTTEHSINLSVSCRRLANYMSLCWEIGCPIACKSGAWVEPAGRYVDTGAIRHGQQIPIPAGYSQNQCKWSVSNSSNYHGRHPFYFGGQQATVDGNRVVTCGFWDEWSFYPSGNCSYVMTCD